MAEVVGVPGLRERKKAATRAALSAAASRLVMEHGLEHVTIEAIAAAANVSPRTFHNYFSSREEAVVASIVDWAQRMTDELRDRPAEEPIWDSLQTVIVASLDDSPATREQMSRQIELFTYHPSVLANQLAAFDGLRRRFAEVIADRTGTDAEHDMYPHLLAGSAAHVVKIATDMWVTGHPDAVLRDLVLKGFALVRAGLPMPAARVTSAGDDPT